MNTLQKIGYTLVGLTTSASVALAGPFDGKAVTVSGTSQNTADVEIQNLINKALLYLSILAVVYGIWGGFQIVTAGGDEEKVKKGRTILIQVGIGIIVIWLAGSIVKWVVGLVTGA
jgi:hypothetical protein